MSIFAVTLSLFLVLNVLGNIPLFIGFLSKFDIRKQKKIITRELLVALFILLLFNFFGDDILRLLGISQPIIGIAGGTLLFIIALSMIFPRTTDKKQNEISPRQEPYIVPLAMPLVAGPGAIATVMVYAEQLHNPWLMTGIIIMAWVPAYLILLFSTNIKYVLGTKGLIACQRLGGMLICLIAVQMFTSGVMTLLQEAFHIPTK
ncbi:MAG: MarC family protein [Chlamydiales bacterium]|nr:MarC family protein [Chlamydiales bacterium]